MPLVIKKCPKCGKKLGFKNEPANKTLVVRCSACLNTIPYCDLLDVVQTPVVVEDKTENPQDNTNTTTIVTPASKKNQQAVLRLMSKPGKTYNLKTGKNIIGRAAPTSSADIQIDTAALKRMSREHAVIEVTQYSGRCSYYFSLYKESLNPTAVSGEKILYGDSFILKHGDLLQLPDAVLRFEILDGDGTDFENITL